VSPARLSATAPPAGRSPWKRRPAPATDRVRYEWLRRIEAEYRSAAITQHLTLWLIQLGASPDLIHAGLRIVRDELAHARLSQRVYVAGGGHAAPRIERDTLQMASLPGEPLEASVARCAVRVFCLGETVAVPLFQEMRKGSTVAPARKALDRILRDEVRHRDFGWTLLGWLLELPAEPVVRDVIAQELADAFAQLRSGYAPPPGTRGVEVTDDERTWGLISDFRDAEIITRAFERDYVPRFTRAGVDPRPAWDEAEALNAGRTKHA
jgi:hypothetical protein